MASDANKKSLGIAIIGCGVVGGGCAKILMESQKEIHERTGIQLELKAVVDKNPANPKALGVPDTLVYEDYTQILTRTDIDVVIELVGGTGIAKEICSKALEHKKHIVTANKALLAHYGAELMALAHKNKVYLAFEASCGGGIPIIRALYDGIAANSNSALFGIVNGTCNYILTEMTQKGTSYADALKDAQRLGFAEANPSLDVQGFDSSHKIALLAGLAFSAQVKLEDVEVKGIDTLDTLDVKAGMDLGYVLKLIAQAQKTEEGLFLRVEPAFINKNHPLSWVNGSFNAISVYSNYLGHSLYYGRGAGSSPTASAIVADLISIGNGSYPAFFEASDIWPDTARPAKILKDDSIIRRYYLRLNVEDRPGVLAGISSILGKHQINVASIHQSEINACSENDLIPLIITLHACSEATIKKSVQELEALSYVSAPGIVIPILDEHPEFS